jgi:leader peptidase (prepilin peptidase)/N-methyltransferase
MLEIIALLCLIGGVVILYVLSAIDLREGLLPNELVMGFSAIGLVFHLCTVFAYFPISQMLMGGFIGASILFLIRAVANRVYEQDALGLGDVKLMGAAGLWLGPYYILIALIVGALAGIVHGLGAAILVRQRTGSLPALSTLSLPAGPGFAIGIVLTGFFAFRTFPALVWP